MKYIVTWSEHATYKTEVIVTNAELAHWANETGILRSKTHLQKPDHKITAEEIADMQRANPAFHRAIIVLFTNNVNAGLKDCQYRQCKTLPLAPG